LLRSTGLIRTADGIIIDPKYGTFEDRSFLFDEAVERLVRAGLAIIAGDKLYALKKLLGATDSLLRWRILCYA